MTLQITQFNCVNNIILLVVARQDMWLRCGDEQIARDDAMERQKRHRHCELTVNTSRRAYLDGTHAVITLYTYHMVCDLLKNAVHDTGGSTDLVIHKHTKGSSDTQIHQLI